MKEGEIITEEESDEKDDEANHLRQRMKKKKN